MSEKLSDEKIQALEGGTVNIYIEKSITISNPGNGLFSATEKMGMSIDIPEGLTVDQTVKHAEQQCSYYLNKWKNNLLGLK